MPFYIIQNDITKIDADAIVNAANENLRPGGGVCGAIFSAAGGKLEASCRAIGHCPTGNAVITDGFNLPARYIIHTVGPVYGQENGKEEELLYSCYGTSLQLAAKHELSSVAFPLISSGIYGYPKAAAFKVASRAIRDFLKDHDMTVYLVIFAGEPFVIDEERDRRIREYIDKRQGVRMEALSVATLAVVSGVDELLKRKLSDVKNRKTETFSDMLLRLIDERGMKDSEAYKRANLDRRLFSKLRKKEYIPNKNTVMALCVALKLSLDESVDLLKRAGYAFSDVIDQDLIVKHYIEIKNYDIYEINEVLYDETKTQLGHHEKEN